MPAAVLVIAAGIGGVIAIITTISNVILKFKEHELKASRPQSAISDERLARIEAAVEAMSIEIERISEGQRFTTKLLSDQTSPVQAFMPRPGKFDTPH